MIMNARLFSVVEARGMLRRILCLTEERVVDMKPQPPLVLLKPMREWRALASHFAPQMAKRVPLRMPAGSSKEDIDKRFYELNAHLLQFNTASIPVYVLKGREWHIPLPYGYRMLGKDDEVYTFIDGANAQPMVDNPYLEDVHYTHFRNEYLAGKPKDLIANTLPVRK